MIKRKRKPARRRCKHALVLERVAPGQLFLFGVSTSTRPCKRTVFGQHYCWQHRKERGSRCGQ